jgi:predicted membrane channel-forming protein YqfA (hemolysin III family)
MMGSSSLYPMPDESSRATLSTLRRLQLAILIFGAVGTATELLLIGHDEDGWQMIPLVVLALAVGAAVVLLLTRARAAAVRTFRAAMLLLMLSGATGSVLHYRANMEFKLEMDPSLSGLALFWSVVRAKAPPALAPGNMALLGMLGFACVFRLGDPSSPRRL